LKLHRDTPDRADTDSNNIPNYMDEIDAPDKVLEKLKF